MEGSKGGLEDQESESAVKNTEIFPNHIGYLLFPIRRKRSGIDRVTSFG